MNNLNRLLNIIIYFLSGFAIQLTLLFFVYSVSPYYAGMLLGFKVVNIISDYLCKRHERELEAEMLNELLNKENKGE